MHDTRRGLWPRQNISLKRQWTPVTFIHYRCSYLARSVCHCTWTQVQDIWWEFFAGTLSVWTQEAFENGRLGQELVSEILFLLSVKTSRGNVEETSPLTHSSRTHSSNLQEMFSKYERRTNIKHRENFWDLYSISHYPELFIIKVELSGWTTRFTLFHHIKTMWPWVSKFLCLRLLLWKVG